MLGSKLMCTQAGSPELSRVLCWCARKQEAGFCVGVHAIGQLGFVLVCTQKESKDLCWCAHKGESGFCAGVHQAVGWVLSCAQE